MFYIYSIALYICLLLPYSVNMLFDLKSVAPGFVLGQFLIFLFSFKQVFRSFKLKVGALYFLMFFMLFLGSVTGEYFYYQKIFNSFIFFGCLFLVATNAAFFVALSKDNPKLLFKFISFVWKLTTVVGIVSLLLFHKFFIFFGEPSYFALFYGAFTVCYSVINKRIAIPIIFLLFFTVFTPVATMGMFIPLLLLCHFSFRVAFAPILMLFFLIVFMPNIFGEYFSSRLATNAVDANLSSLLFIANWLDLVGRVETLELIGSGIGGHSEFIRANNAFTQSLIQRYGDELTFTSGTFLIARFVQSVGLIGFLPILFYIFMTFKAYIHSLHTNAGTNDKLAFSLLACLIPDFFFRTTGVLSFSMFLFFFSLLFHYSMKAKQLNTEGLSAIPQKKNRCS